MTAPSPASVSFRDPFERLFFCALRIRLAEERVAAIYPTDKIQSPIHLSIGQEPVSAACCEPLAETDLAFGTYRGHALYLAKGGSMRGLFAELYGKSTGCTAGKGGSMHLAAPKVGFMGTSAIVASTIPHAVGAALAARLRGTGQVVACFFGDGAAGEGVYHESLNFAALKSVPVWFICEHNGYAVHTRTETQLSFSVAAHARAYGIETEDIQDGSDLALLHDRARAAVATVRREQRPMLFEIKTYRYRQHAGPAEDCRGCRHRELAEWRARDPLVQRDDLRARFAPMILEEIEDAVRFAEQSPYPALEALHTDVR